MALRPDWPPDIRAELSRLHGKYLGILDKMEEDRVSLTLLLERDDLDEDTRRYLEGIKRTIQKAHGAIAQVQYEARSAYDIMYNPGERKSNPEKAVGAGTSHIIGRLKF